MSLVVIILIIIIRIKIIHLLTNVVVIFKPAIIVVANVFLRLISHNWAANVLLEMHFFFKSRNFNFIGCDWNVLKK